MPKINLIAAIDDRRGIAIGGKLPWNLPSDRKYFRDHIKEGPVLMGWNTFKANGYQPYGTGKNTVVTNKLGEYPNVEYTDDLAAYFKGLKGDVWVAGGGQIFKETLPYATHLYLTQVEGDFDCDIFFPEFESEFVLQQAEEPETENGITFTYQIWERKT